MSAARRYALDTGWALSSSLVVMGFGFLLNLVVGNSLGPQGLGVFAVSLAIYTIASTVGILGVHNALIKYAAEFQDDRYALDVLTSAAALTAALLGLTTGSLLWLLSAPLSALFHMPQLGGMLRILGVGMPFFMVNKTLLAFLNGLRLMRSHALCESWRYVVNIVLLILLLRQGQGVRGVAGAIAGSEVAVLAALILATRGRFRLRLRGLRRESTRLVRFGCKVLMVGIIADIRSRLNLLITGYFLGESQVGIYSVATMIWQGLHLVPNAVQRITAPATAYLHGKEQHGAVQHLVQNAIKYASILLTLTSLAVAVPGRSWIRLLYPGRPDFAAAIGPLRILAGAWLIQGALAAVGATHSSLGRPGLGVWITGPALVLNALFTLLLVPLWGLGGAAWATALTSCVSAFITVVLFRKALDIALELRWLAEMIGLGLGVYLAALAGERWLGPWLSTALAAVSYLALLVGMRLLDRADWVRLQAILGRKA